MAEHGSVIEQYRHLIGTETVYTAPEEVGRASLRLFALSVGDLNPLYMSRDEAEKGPHGDVVAPPTFICETTQYYQGLVDIEGGFTDRVKLPEGQIIRAGNEYVFHQPLRPTDIITARWVIQDVTEKRGRSGTLLFILIEISYTNQHGELLAENHETVAYRFEDQVVEETSA